MEKLLSGTGNVTSLVLWCHNTEYIDPDGGLVCLVID